MKTSGREPRPVVATDFALENRHLTTAPTTVKENLHCTHLNNDQRMFLLRAARAAVAAHLDGGVLSPATTLMGEAWAHDSGGVFVTLRCHAELRGCIGVIEAAASIGENVLRCAILAATEDPRFPSLTREELPDTRFEISRLSVPRPVSGPGDLRVGDHGVIVTKGRHRGLLLPQVAVEQGWSAEEFLGAACRKAGLPRVAWKEAGVVLEVFSAEVFSEDTARS